MIRAGVVAALTASLVACASLPRAPIEPPAARPLDEAFSLNGRFAVRYGKEGGSGRIQWEHSASGDDLAILSPIGQGLARIVRKDGVYTLTMANGGEPRSSTDPDVLTERALGWRLPITGLPHWIVGRPQPGEPAKTERGEDGKLAALEQAGWRIEYLARHPENGLPERMRVRRNDLDLRLAIEEWSALPGTPP